MMEDILIIDDCLPKDWCDWFEKQLLETNFSWYFSRSANYGDDTKIENWQSHLSDITDTVDTPQFTHSFMHSDGSLSSAFPFVINLLTVSPFVVGKLMRIKGNITTSSKKFNKISYGVPHTDYINPIKDLITCLYYVNDSDGDTVLFEEFNTGETHFDKLNVYKTISPKKGRMVIFDGNRFHAANNPSNGSPRVVVNINYIAYFKDE